MYQVIGLASTLKWFGVSCVLVFILLNFGDITELLDPAMAAATLSNSASKIFKEASKAATIVGLATYLVGQTPVFPWICKIPGLRNWFPPIDGEWLITTHSNWSRLANGGGEKEADLHITHGKVKITSRFFSVQMIFESNDFYSESRTVHVSVQRSPHLGTTQLNYIYENFTLVPKATDTNLHNGAARVYIKEDQGELKMIGTYFTDRKWTEGMNTAGKVTFTRVSESANTKAS